MTAAKRSGPKLHMAASCTGCSHEQSKEYSCQSDWGFNYYCTAGERRQITSAPRTPTWCPLLAAAERDFILTALPRLEPTAGEDVERTAAALCRSHDGAIFYDAAGCDGAWRAVARAAIAAGLDPSRLKEGT